LWQIGFQDRGGNADGTGMGVQVSVGPVLLLFLVLATTAAAPALAQDPLAMAKDLYNNAAYQDALAALKDPAVQATNPEVHQYRALCLAALGQVAEAQAEFETLVAVDPFFVLDPREFAPRFVVMFNETRRRLLPDEVRRAFAEARNYFQNGDQGQAKRRFNEVRRLLDDAMLTTDQNLRDLRVLADGFADLLNAERPASPSARSTPANVPVAPGAPPATVERRTSVTSVPIAIRQQLPEWRPVDANSANRTLSGAVKVIISPEGRVTSAVMLRRIHPFYDRAVLDAASGWLYKPATLDGKAVASEKIIEIELSPR
jgi:tetratricopeptide (TPR) repeat protein